MRRLGSVLVCAALSSGCVTLLGPGKAQQVTFVCDQEGATIRFASETGHDPASTPDGEVTVKDGKATATVTRHWPLKWTATAPGYPPISGADESHYSGGLLTAMIVECIFLLPAGIDLILMGDSRPYISYADTVTVTFGASAGVGASQETAGDAQRCVLCYGKGLWTGGVCPGCNGTGVWGRR